MSYILEALKKAEQEREFGQVPGIDSPHAPPPQHPPRRWPWVIAAALLLNVLVVAGLWWHGGAGTSDATTPAARPAGSVAESAPDQAVAPPVTSQPNPAPQAETIAPPVETDTAHAPTAEPAPTPPAIAQRPLRPLPLPDPPPAATPAPAEREPLPLRAEEPPTPVAAAPGPAPLQAEEFFAPAAAPTATPTSPPDIVELRAPSVPPPSPAEPTWQDLPLWPLVPEQIRRQVTGQLVLNGHVFSKDPDERFVLLNMKKYREGEQLSEGPRLEAITREGVILAVPNGRFRFESQ